MKYTKEEQAIIENWPTVTKADIEKMNDLFPHYLFYRWSPFLPGSRDVNMLTIHTSCCGRNEKMLFPLRTEGPEDRELLSKLSHKNSIVCPWCGRQATVIDLAKAKRRKTLRYVTFIILLHNQDNAIYADALVLKKGYESDEELSAPPEYWCSSGYRFTHGAVLQLDHQIWGSDEPYPTWELGKLGRKKWVQEPFKGGSISFFHHEAYQIINGEMLADNPAYRYCAYFEQWKNGKYPQSSRYYRDFISYLTAYSIYPKQVEMLVKANMHKPVSDLIYDRKKWAAAMCWEEPDIRKSLNLTAPELREFMKLGTNQMFLLEVKHYTEKYFQKSWSFGQCDQWWRMWGNSMDVLRFLKKYRLDPDRFERYVNDLSYRDPDIYADPDTLFDIYKDYLEAAYQTGACMEHSCVLWPDDLFAAHTAACNALGDKIERDLEGKAIAKDMERRKCKYEFELDGYCIRFPLTAGSIKREGKILSHCVGGYAERHINGVLTILFLRRIETPHMPYVTIEMHGNNIAQIHGKNNDIGQKSPREIHKEFLDTWLMWLAAGSKRDKDGKPIIPKRKKAKNAA